MQSETSVHLVGAFPPPVHGMSMVNDRVAQVLRQKGAVVNALDISPGDVSGWATLLTRWRRVLQCIGSFWLGVRNKRAATLYVGLSGGWGQLYDLLFVGLGRLYGCRIFLHHHSFAYLDCPRVLARLLFWTAGVETWHTVLCAEMAGKLAARYPTCRRIRVVSNVAFTSSSPNVPRRERLRTIGYLSNVMRSKGIMEFLDALDALNAQGVEVAGRIAGPIFEPDLAEVLRRRCASNPQIKYVGPVYGEAKDSFLRETDALLFPTSYQNEAEPLTLWEALSHGVPVLAWGRGCIPSMLQNSRSQAVPVDVEFVGAAVKAVAQWHRRPEMFAGASEEARQRFDDMKKSSRHEFEAFCDALMDRRHER